MFRTVKNQLTISGANHELKRFVSSTHSGFNIYDFNKLVPLVSNAFKKHYNMYDIDILAGFTDVKLTDQIKLALKIWDNKCGAYHIVVDKDWPSELENPSLDRIYFEYCSDNYPMWELLQKISAQFPTLTFGVSFTFENGGDYAGWELLKDKIIVDSGQVNTDTLPIYDCNETYNSEKYALEFNKALIEIGQKCKKELSEKTETFMRK